MIQGVRQKIYKVSLGHYVVVVQLLSHVHLFATPWTAAHQTSLSITKSRNLLKLMSIKLVMPSNRLIPCCPLPLPRLGEVSSALQ